MQFEYPHNQDYEGGQVCPDCDLVMDIKYELLPGAQFLIQCPRCKRIEVMYAS